MSSYYSNDNKKIRRVWLTKMAKVPAGKGANDLAQPAFMTSKSSEITTDPSAAIPQYSLTPPSEPCNHYDHLWKSLLNTFSEMNIVFKHAKRNIEDITNRNILITSAAKTVPALLS